MGTRMREIYTACIFALCLENQTNNRYAIGFQPKDQHRASILKVERLLEDDFEVCEDDCDVVLVEVANKAGNSATHHRCQLTSFIHQPGTTEIDWVNFIKKKQDYAHDEDLRLVINCEQEGPCNHSFLSAYLCQEGTRCPYSQVFLVGQIADDPPVWQCWLLYPQLAIFPELHKQRADDLLRDRPRLNREY